MTNLTIIESNYRASLHALHNIVGISISTDMLNARTDLEKVADSIQHHHTATITDNLTRAMDILNIQGGLLRTSRAIELDQESSPSDYEHIKEYFTQATLVLTYDAHMSGK